MDTIVQYKELTNKVAKEFDVNIDVKELQRIEHDLVTKCQNFGGIGLAGPQIGYDFRVFVVNVPNSDGTFFSKAYFNPEIIDASPDVCLSEEGCLSCKNSGFVRIKRHKYITLRFIDSNNESITAIGEDLLAKVWQHEIDHLNGICILDHASKLKRDMAAKKLKKQQRKRLVSKN